MQSDEPKIHAAGHINTHASQWGTGAAKASIARAHHGNRIIGHKELEQTEDREHHSSALKADLIISMTKIIPVRNPAWPWMGSISYAHPRCAKINGLSHLCELWKTLLEINAGGRTAFKQQWILWKDRLTFNFQIWNEREAVGPGAGCVYVWSESEYSLDCPVI